MTFNKYDFKVSDVCWCGCHKINTIQLDMISCCSLSGEKYLDEDGKLIIDTFIKLMEWNEEEDVCPNCGAPSKDRECPNCGTKK